MIRTKKKTTTESIKEEIDVEYVLDREATDRDIGPNPFGVAIYRKVQKYVQKPNDKTVKLRK